MEALSAALPPTSKEETLPSVYKKNPLVALAIRGDSSLAKWPIMVGKVLAGPVACPPARSTQRTRPMLTRARSSTTANMPTNAHWPFSAK
jgi:hypothetical protein